MPDPAPSPDPENPGASRARAHPRGLYTLFFTEMWERLGYYGMRALLILFMVTGIEHGGLGLTDTVAAAIYGLFTSAVYLVTLPGGWMGDRLLGTQRAIWMGGVLLAAGYFLMAVPVLESFYLGLLVVALGSGLLKPNISATVALLYPEGGARRDAGFTLFYMGVNLGAALGPIVCASLAKAFGWRVGFAAAGIGMGLGLIQFAVTRRHLGEAGRHAPPRVEATPRDWRWVGAALVALTVLTALVMGGVIHPDPVALSRYAAAGILGLAAVYFVSLFLFAGLDAAERRRLLVVGVLFLASAVFWAGFEQAGSSLNLFAERYTDRSLGFLQPPREIPTGWFQSLGAFFVITLAPAVASLWLLLARRGRDLSPAGKFALALVLLGAGFLVMAAAAVLVTRGGKVLPYWLIATYLLHSFGELCLSPVGLSTVTKLAPARLASQMLGLWFLATSLGNLLAGMLAGRLQADNLTAMPGQFLQVAGIAGLAAVLLLLLVRPIRRLTSAPP
ncbi:MAG: peptide MFS transporter [Limisphaerales bacterium]